jgi:ankyrin repeat protein
MEAAYRNHVPSVEALLQHGASLTMKDPEDLTPLCRALDSRSFLAASALIKAGASPNVQCGANRLTPLMVVATHEKADQSGNVPVDDDWYLSDGVSPLEVGQLLVSKGADVNALSRGGITALMIAAGYDNAPLIGLLIQAGAKIDVHSESGKTALDIAKDNGNDTAAKTLELMARFASLQRPAVPAQPPQR